MNEVKTHTRLDKSTEVPVQKAPRDFQRDLYLITDHERRVTELRSDLSQLRDPVRLMSQPRWRAFLARSAELIRAIPEQRDSPDMQKLKEQTTGDYNRAIRRLRYEGLKDLPSGLPQHSQPESREPHESSVIQTYGLDLPSGERAQQDLHALKTKVETREKTLEQRASSIEAQRQRRSYNELAATYNRWVERFEKPEQWKRPELRLKGGLYLASQPDGHLCARFMTLRDPSGTLHRFYEGQHHSDIADTTHVWLRQWIEENGTTSMAVHRQLIQVYTLTEENVKQLRQGDAINGWTCLEQRFVPVQERTVYTDQGGELIAVSAIPYQISPTELPSDFQGIVLGPADPNRDCYGTTFLEGRGWLWANSNKMQTILDDNNYYQISDFQQAKHGDIYIYRENGAITHAAPVLGWGQTNEDILSGNLLPELPLEEWGKGNYSLKINSKCGTDLDLGHDWDDPGIIQEYGQPTLYRTDRAGGNTLIGA